MSAGRALGLHPIGSAIFSNIGDEGRSRPSWGAPGARTRAGLTSRPPTSTVPPTRSRRAARAGWVAISTRCRGRWTRWPRGIPRKTPQVRSCPHRPVSRRFPTRLCYTYASPNCGSAALQERQAAQAMAVNPAAGRPHLAFVNRTSLAAIETLDRVAHATSYTLSVAYPNGGFGRGAADRGGHLRTRHWLTECERNLVGN